MSSEAKVASLMFHNIRWAKMRRPKDIGAAAHVLGDWFTYAELDTLKICRTIKD